MKTRISRQFFAHYLVVSLLVLLSTVLALSFLAIASRLAASAFATNRYPASALMRDDYAQIDASPVVESGGSVTIIDRDFRVVRSEGQDALAQDQLTAVEFTEFLVWSKHKNTPFHHDILYNPEGEFWLIVTFPASIRLDFAFILNSKAAAGDLRTAALILAAVLAVYLLLVFALTALYSAVTAAQVTVPLRRLTESTRRLREGDYSARVDLKLRNEFGELQDIVVEGCVLVFAPDQEFSELNSRELVLSQGILAFRAYHAEISVNYGHTASALYHRRGIDLSIVVAHQGTGGVSVCGKSTGRQPAGDGQEGQGEYRGQEDKKRHNQVMGKELPGNPGFHNVSPV
jgi:HAMP domain-containing protein